MHLNGHDMPSGSTVARGALGGTYSQVSSVFGLQISMVTSGPALPCGQPVAAPQQSVSAEHLPLLSLSPLDCGFSHLPPVSP